MVNSVEVVVIHVITSKDIGDEVTRLRSFQPQSSPTRKIVYGAFALFFDVMITPLLRDSMLLDKTVGTISLMTSLWPA